MVNKALLIFILCFSGCSLFHGRVSEISIDTPMEIIPTSTQNINNTLSVSVRGTAKAEIPSTIQLLTRLTALKESEVVGDALYVFPQRVYREGEIYDFMISVSSPMMTDYHLSLLWGDEAVETILSTQNVLTTHNKERDIYETQSLVELIAIETTPAPLECSGGKCKTGVTITGNFKNPSNDPKNKIKLGVVLIDNEGKELGPEEVLSLDGVTLAPQSELPFEVGVVLPEGVSATDASAKVRIIDSH